MSCGEGDGCSVGDGCALMFAVVFVLAGTGELSGTVRFPAISFRRGLITTKNNPANTPPPNNKSNKTPTIIRGIFDFFAVGAAGGAAGAPGDPGGDV